MSERLIPAGLKLKELRSETRLSVHKVSRAVGISSSYLSEIERGLKEPSDEVLEALAEYYKVGKSELFSLYGKIAPAETSLLLDNPAFRKTIIRMSTDDSLTVEDRLEIANALKSVYESLKKRP